MIILYLLYWRRRMCKHEYPLEKHFQVTKKLSVLLNMFKKKDYGKLLTEWGLEIVWVIHDVGENPSTLILVSVFQFLTSILLCLASISMWVEGRNPIPFPLKEGLSETRWTSWTRKKSSSHVIFFFKPQRVLLKRPALLNKTRCSKTIFVLRVGWVLKRFCELNNS